MFQALYLDADADPFLEDIPTIDVFSFDSDGDKVTYVDDAEMTASEDEVGRYTYVFDVGSDFSDGDVVYGQIRAVDPLSDEILLIESTLNLASISSVSSSSAAGLRAQFVKGG